MRPRSRPPALVLGVALGALCLAACTSFDPARRFAAESVRLTAAIQAELAQVDALCRHEAGRAIVVRGLADEAPLADCERLAAAEADLAAASVEVLDAHARLLAALADGDALDLRAQLRRTGARLRDLRDRGGQPLPADRELRAATRLAELLGEVATRHERAAGVQRLVDVRGDLDALAAQLRGYFLAAPAAPPAPYAARLALTAGSIASTEAALASPVLRAAEPIRTAELLRELRGPRRALADRGVPPPVTDEAVPARIAAALEAWQQALAAFAAQPFARDPAPLQVALDRLHERGLQAHEAARSALGPWPPPR